MKQNFKISFILLLLSCVTFSSVLGISQNESVRLADKNIALFTHDDVLSGPLSKAIYLESTNEKNFVFENEQEDNKEGAFDDTSILNRSLLFFASGISILPGSENCDNTVSLNILYCIFRL